MSLSSPEIKIFVYGTLKPGGFYWDKFCKDKVTKFIPAKAQGLLYALDPGYPGMTPAEDCWVSGYLLTFTDSAHLEAIDGLEGFEPHRSAAENEYNREETTIYSLSGRPMTNAWVYYMSPEKIEELGGRFIERGLWDVNASVVEDKIAV